MVIVGVDMDITVSLMMGMADIQITDMVITDIGILIETAMATAIDCENCFSNSMPCNWQVCARHHYFNQLGEQT
jgi:hypothetical protein